MHTFKDLNSAFCESLAIVKDQGSNVESRGTKQREILFHHICIEDPTALTIAPPLRKFKPVYAIAEWLWYLSQDKEVKNIGKFAETWLLIQDENGQAESNYGEYIFGDQTGLSGSQWRWVVQELLRDRDTRRATISINQPYHKNKNKLDYPCTNNMHFFIRDNQLHLGVNMRSNCAVFGFCNDVWTFCMFQQLMLNELNDLGTNLTLGRYYHSAGSFHVYERHWKMQDTILANYRKTHTGNYPSYRKYQLEKIVTLNEMFLEHALTKEDISLEKIKDHTKRVMELIYV